VFAAIFYLTGAVMLMANMAGYALGHYPQKFDLDDHQRTLILQTMMFFFWLAGGAGIFVRIEDWSYSNALYFCNVVRSARTLEPPRRTGSNCPVNLNHRLWGHNTA